MVTAYQKAKRRRSFAQDGDWAEKNLWAAAAGNLILMWQCKQIMAMAGWLHLVWSG